MESSIAFPNRTENLDKYDFFRQDKSPFMESTLEEGTFPNRFFFSDNRPSWRKISCTEYPTFTDSYTKNQQALLRALGLTSPSQAPFRRIPCFMVYTKETAQTWTPSTTYILTPESEEAESDWLCLAFSVVALHHWDEWPEKDQVDCFDRFRNWQCEIDENDIGFLSQFFAEAWKNPL
jgi:hypothetical protein